MNDYDPWIVDLRKGGMNGFITRVGLPSLPNYKMNKFRFFTMQIVLVLFIVCGFCMFEIWNPHVLSNNSVTFFKESRRILIETSNVQQNKQKALILLTNHRSGSSFLGQFFNQRSDTFYIYEPLMPFQDHCMDENNKNKVSHLRNLFNCKIEGQRDLFRRIGTPLTVSQTPGKTCLPNNFCFRHKIKALCTKELCKSGNPVSCRGCEPVDVRKASHKCQSADLLVIKVIRMCDIELLQPLLEDPNMNVKILHLVRDPRGVYNSREKVLVNNLKSSIARTCNETVHNWKTVTKEVHGWLKDKYKIIRYEDVCRHPLEMAAEIYEFAGVNMTPAMEKWIESNSQGGMSELGDSRAFVIFGKMRRRKKLYGRQRNQRKRFAEMIPENKFGGLPKSLILERMKQIIHNDPYTTSRNSSTNWRKWTFEQNFNTTISVQEICKEALSTFRYIPITKKSRPNYTNSSSLIKNFCPEEQLSFNEITCNMR